MATPFTEPVVLQVTFLGIPMATLGYREADRSYALEFTRQFLATGHDPSPLHLPIESVTGPRVFRAGDSPFAGGLPGLIADSLPDAWGEHMLTIEAPGLKTVLGKLAAIGKRGPGALTFEPVLGQGADATAALSDLAALAREASRLAATTRPLTPSQVDVALANGGSSLGGAYPKVTAHLPLNGPTLDLRQVLIGGAPPSGYRPCILKFSPANDEGGGGVEFALMEVAHQAGINTPTTTLVNDGTRRHFAVERFDRYVRADGTVGRKHVHTLSGMLHRRASDTENPLDYEDFMRLSRRLVGANGAVECLRRAIFNVLATNRDDHGRNHAFVYDEVTRTWDLAPAYDLNPSVANRLIGLLWLGRDIVPRTFDDLRRLAEIGGVTGRRAREVFAEVEAAVFGGWSKAAEAAGVPKDTREAWLANMETQSQELRDDVARSPSRRRSGPKPGG